VHRWVPRLALIFAGALVPWVVLLSQELPDRVRVHNWSVSWIGLDVLVALGLLTIAWLVHRRDGRVCLVAPAVAALLTVDAWLDTTTAQTSAGLRTALLMAAMAELPLAIACVLLAVLTFRAVHRHPGPGPAADGAGTVEIPAPSPPTGPTRPVNAGTIG
jgi:hypothetical protein